MGLPVLGTWPLLFYFLWISRLKKRLLLNLVENRNKNHKFMNFRTTRFRYMTITILFFWFSRLKTRSLLKYGLTKLNIVINELEKQKKNHTYLFIYTPVKINFCNIIFQEKHSQKQLLSVD